MHHQSLIQDLVQNPAIRDYIVSFSNSEILCVEGADTKDLSEGNVDFGAVFLRAPDAVTPNHGAAVELEVDRQPE